MKQVELIYDSDCPNVKETRTQLLKAFHDVGMPPRWTEWECGDPTAPAYVQSYGSPTILVEGKDVAGIQPLKETSCCRLYADGLGSYHGVPAVSLIASALRAQVEKRTMIGGMGSGGGWLRTLASVPGSIFALLPVGVCPLCLPAYAGLLGSIGLGFVVEGSYVLPVLILLLLLALFALGFRAKSRRGYGPLFVGILGACTILLGKFYYIWSTLTYIGVVVLIVASIWNGSPRRKRPKSLCFGCSPLEKTKNIQP